MLHLPTATIADIQNALRSRELSVRELVLQAAARIAELDRGPRGLNAVLELNPDALALADVLDAQLAAGRNAGPLFGVPVLLKDNIDTGELLRTSAGSLALAGHFPAADAHVAALLRRAGALILGKANMTELANSMTQGMPGGYSARGGQVACPYDRNDTPSGSSSGSAVAVAAGYCPVTVGPESCGSIISPAWKNGVVGVKPSEGLVSRRGIIPISHTLDTAGPIARCVRDAAVLLGALAGEDPADPSTLSAAARGGRPGDYARFLDGDGLRGLRVGYNPNAWDALNGEEQAAVADLQRLLTDAGAEIVELAPIPPASGIWDIAKYEFKRSLDTYLAALPPAAPVRTLAGIIEYNQAHADRALRYGQTVLLEAQNETSGQLTEPAYWTAVAAREELIRTLNSLFDDNRLDVLLCVSVTNFAPFSGFPAVTIPVGRTQSGLPVGSYWMARRFDEGRLLRAVYAVEQRLGLRLSPPL